MILTMVILFSIYFLFNRSQLVNTLATVLKELGITEKHAVREYALLNASQEAAEFAQGCEAFEHKYDISFDEFEKQLQSRDQEIFKEEADLLAWKFAAKGAVYGCEKIKQLKQEI